MDQSKKIVHLDLDSFFVSVERLKNSSLTGRPVVIGGLSDRGVVSSCSYEARAFGIHSAMPVRMAKRLCSDAIFIRGDMESYTRYSKLVTEIIADEAPLFEKASIDEHYLDISGMDRFFGCLKWAQELRAKIIKNSGLPISFGLSVNKTVSKIATGEAKPNGELFVNTPGVLPFIHPLSIRKMPMIGKQTYSMLRSMGVATIGTLSAIPVEMMHKVLGKNGISLWKKANGIDNSPIIPWHDRKSISTERTFDRDTIDIHLLRELLISMVEKIAFQLRKEGKLTSCISVKIRYSNFDTHTQQRHIAYTSFDHVLINNALELFEKVYQRRLRVRLIGVRFSGLIPGLQQLDLFEKRPEMIDLYMAMDKMRLRYGSQAVRRAVGLRKEKL